MEDEIFLTKQGYTRLERELNELLGNATSEAAAKIAEAREDGDFDEDPTFFDAMSEKNMLDERINRLQTILRRATVIEEDLDPDSATPGDRITVLDMDEKEELVFELLSGAELTAGRRGVSLGSPVGKALLGKKVGDKLEVKVPDGVTRYKVLKIDPIQVN